MSRLLPAALLVSTLASTAVPAARATTEVVDTGNYIVSVGERPIGAESFIITSHHDSLFVSARYFQLLPGTGASPDTLEKHVAMVLSGPDFGLLSYESSQRYRGAEQLRGVVMGDTAFSIYREHGQRGEGSRMILPPGRMFVLESQLFTLIDVITMSLHDKTFDTRPITLLTLGQQDSLIEASAVDLGDEAIRWGARRVTARKLSLSDGTTTFLLWADPSGHLLRLEHQATGLRVVREPPAIKRRSKPPSPGG